MQSTFPLNLRGGYKRLLSVPRRQQTARTLDNWCMGSDPDGSSARIISPTYREAVFSSMGTTSISQMMRVRIELISAVQELNRLIREGQGDDVVRGVALLIRSIEHGESFGYGHAIARIERLEEKFQNLEFSGTRALQTEPRLAIREAELLRKFGIDAKRLEGAIAAGHQKEKWIALQTGWQCLGFGRWVPGV